IAYVILVQRMSDEAQAFIRSWIFRGEPLSNGREIGVGAFDSCSLFQTCDEPQIVIAASTLLVRLHGPRRPQLHLAHGKEEAARHHSDDGEGFSVERDGAIDDRGIAIEASLPERIA